MQQKQTSQKQAGIALFEVLAVLLVLVVLIGAGVYVVHRHNEAKPGTVSSTGTSTQTISAKPGTTQYVDQVTTNAATAETNSNNTADSQYQQAATSDNAAMSNLGGAYNESTL